MAGRAKRWAPGAVLALAVLAVYLPSIQNYVGDWDTAEFQTVAAILGIAHPTGFPAYVLLSWLFSRLDVFYDLEGRTGLLSALLVTGAMLGAYRIARDLGADRWLSAAILAACAFGDVVWLTATRADVHAMSLCVGIWTMALLLRWFTTGAPRLFLGGAALAGLGLATHGNGVWTALAGLVLVLARRDALTRGLAFRATLLALATALLPYFYVPLRSMYVQAHGLDPARRLGLSSDAFWNYGNPSNLERFIAFASGAEFPKHEAFASLIDINGLPSHLVALWSSSQAQYGWIFCVFAAAGFVLVFLQARVAAGALAVYAFAPALFVLGYHLEGFADRYLMPLFATSAIVAAVAASAVVARARVPGVEKVAVALAVAIALNMELRHADRIHRADPGPYQQRAALAATTSDHAIIIAPWNLATRFAFFAYATHTLGNRVILTGFSDAYAEKIPGWLRACHHVYVVGSAPAPIPGVSMRTSNTPELFSTKLSLARGGALRFHQGPGCREPAQLTMRVR